MLSPLPLPPGFALRPVTDADESFLKELFASTRHFLQGLPLPQRDIDALVEQQYRLQQASYAAQWPDARTLILQRAGEAIGQITIAQDQASLHLVEIILAAARRGEGHGSALLGALQSLAQAQGLKLGLSVDRQNLAAARLYRRLGFLTSAVSDTHEYLTWSPTHHKQPSRSKTHG